VDEPDWGDDVLPAWGLPAGGERPVDAAALPAPVTAEWAYGGATGAGVRVCVLDSGIEAGHPLVGEVERSVTVVDEEDGDGEPAIVDDGEGDVSGHGTACAGIIRSLAPEASISSARVLGSDVNGRFATLRAGIAWAVDERFDVCNLSLSVRNRAFALDLCELADRASHGGTMLVCSAHNLPVESYPWRFASVVSVGSHDEPDPWRLYWNPEPPVELYARGVGVPIAWPGGGTIRATGNSFAAPHVAGLLALVRSKHPGLTPFELKTVLYRLAANVREAGGP
jgi:subtilisin family serine protease